MSLLIGGRGLLPIGSSNLSDKLTKAVGSGPTLPRLAKLLLSCDDELVKLHVAEAMQSITIFRDGCQQVVDQGTVVGITQYLCATLPDLPATKSLALCLLNLLQTLAAVTMYANNGMRDILGTGLIAKVVGFLGNDPSGALPNVLPKHSTHATDIVRQALRLLWHCGNNMKARVEILQAEGVRVITQFLSDTDSKVREAAICALNVVSLETQGKKDIYAHSLTEIARIIHEENETTYLQETAVQLCRSASELPVFRFAFARHVLKSVWLLEKVYGTAALAAISPLLFPKEDMETRTQACVVAHHFLTSSNISFNGDDIRVPPVCPLPHVEHPPSFSFEECVDILHNLIDLTEQVEQSKECLKALAGMPKPKNELANLLRAGLIVPPESQKAFVESLVQD